MLALVCGLVIAIGVSSRYVTLADPDGWWPLLFALAAAGFALLLRSTLAAGLPATRLPLHAEPAAVGAWQWCWYLPVLLRAEALTNAGRTRPVRPRR